MTVHFGIEHVEFWKNRDGRVACERTGTCVSACGMKRVNDPLKELPVAEALALFNYVNYEASKQFVIVTVVGTVWFLASVLLVAMTLCEPL